MALAAAVAKQRMEMEGWDSVKRSEVATHEALCRMPCIPEQIGTTQKQSGCVSRGKRRERYPVIAVKRCKNTDATKYLLQDSIF